MDGPEGHKLLPNLHRSFVLCCKSQIYAGDFAKFVPFSEYMNFRTYIKTYNFEPVCWVITYWEENTSKTLLIGSMPSLLLIFVPLPFNNLPYTKDLYCCASVCQRFRQISYEEKLWSTLNLSDKKIPIAFIEQILIHGTKYLSLAGTKIYGEKLESVN